MITTKKIGELYEKKAVDFLSAQGYKLIAQNYLVAGIGELDVVVYDSGSDTLICCEVKAQKGSGYGQACERVTPKKQQKLINTMQHFLQRNPEYDHSAVRFDVMAYDTLSGECEWIVGAFLA